MSKLKLVRKGTSKGNGRKFVFKRKPTRSFRSRILKARPKNKMA